MSDQHSTQSSDSSMQIDSGEESPGNMCSLENLGAVGGENQPVKVVDLEMEGHASTSSCTGKSSGSEVPEMETAVDRLLEKHRRLVPGHPSLQTPAWNSAGWYC